jgi:CO dehydrogenase flavoprotein C-terminal domain
MLNILHLSGSPLIHSISLHHQWMGILKEIAPAVRRVAFVHVPEITANVAFMRMGEASSAALGMTVSGAGVRNPADIERVLTEFAQEPNGGLIVGTNGRTVPLMELHRLPGDTPHIETVLEPGEVITAITVPASPVARRSHYLKVRDRASFEFAVVSAAVALDMNGSRIRTARVALGGVASKPWRVPKVEAALVGASLDPAALRRAAALAVEGAHGRGHNDFKLELMQRAIVRAVETAGARA